MLKSYAERQPPIPPAAGAIALTARDRELLQALVQKVRLFSLRQIAFHWWRGDLANARRRLRRFAERKLVRRITVSARVLSDLTQPLVVWSPGQQAPDFGSLAYQLKIRWYHLAVRSCAAYLATDFLSQLFGGPPRGELRRPLQVSHDLGVSQVWLRLQATAPQLAAAWRSEDLFTVSRRGEKCPDAYLVDSHEQVTGAIELGGEYKPHRLQAFHEDCAHKNLPYQLW